MIGIGGLGSAAATSVTQWAQALNELQSLQAPSILGASGSVSSPAEIGLTQTSASVSSLGQLFSSLNQLETRNPAAFKALASQLASELQSAAQQQTGNTSQILTNLSNAFQEAATTGKMPQLHHHHHKSQADSYNSSGQPVSSEAEVGLTSSNSSIQQLFTTLTQQVIAALNI
jgi:hypothetical protein